MFNRYSIIFTSMTRYRNIETIGVVCIRRVFLITYHLGIIAIKHTNLYIWIVPFLQILTYGLQFSITSFICMLNIVVIHSALNICILRKFRKC